MFASVSRTCANPVTVAAMIRVNGLNAVRRAGLVPPSVIKAACRSMGDENYHRRKAMSEVRLKRRVRQMLAFARRYGRECLDAAERRPYAIRLSMALVDIWQERLGPRETGRRHGWDVAIELKDLSRQMIRARAMDIGLVLDAGHMPCNDGFSSEGQVLLRAKERARRRIMRRACRLFGVSKDGLKSSSRVRELVLARMLYAYWMKRIAKSSFPEIGRALGGRDHTTALNLVRKWPGARDEARALIAARRDSIPSQPRRRMAA